MSDSDKVHTETKQVSEAPKKDENDDLTVKQLLLSADMLYEKAKTAMQVGRISDAENMLSDALEIKHYSVEYRTQHFGELAAECLDAYLLYGKAILLQVKNSMELFNDSKTNDALEEIERKKEELAEQQETNDGKEKCSPSTKEKEHTTEEQNDNHDDEKNKAEGKNGNEGEEEDEEEEEEEDNATKLERAWEVLEVARLIAEKYYPNTTRLADVYLTVGDIGLEFEHYDTAVSDYEKALAVRHNLGETNTREVAEIYYLIGLALANIPGSTTKCIKSFEEAKHILLEIKKGMTVCDFEDVIKEIDSKLVCFREEEEELKKKMFAQLEAKIPPEVKKTLSQEAINQMLQAAYEKAISNANKNLSSLTSSSAKAKQPIHNLGTVGSIKRKKSSQGEEDGKKLHLE